MPRQNMFLWFSLLCFVSVNVVKKKKKKKTTFESANDLLWTVGFIGHPHAISTNRTCQHTWHTNFVFFISFLLCIFQCYTKEMSEKEKNSRLTLPKYKRTDKWQNRVPSISIANIWDLVNWFVFKDQNRFANGLNIN